MEPYHIKHEHHEIVNHSDIQNKALRIATGCTRDTNTQHLHDKTKVFPIDIHLKQLTEIQIHPLHNLNIYLDLPRNIKATIFYNKEHTNIIKTRHKPDECRENLKHIHTTITLQYLNFRKNNKVTNTTPYDSGFQTFFAQGTLDNINFKRGTFGPLQNCF